MHRRGNHKTHGKDSNNTAKDKQKATKAMQPLIKAMLNTVKTNRAAVTNRRNNHNSMLNRTKP